MDKLPFNWFDLLVIAVITFGCFKGRRRGMSQELVPLLKWVCILVGCAFLYRPVADFIASMAFSRLFASYAAYLLIAAVIAGLVTVLNRSLGGKLVGSDVFGKAEYYLGIAAGGVRYVLILLFGLALLNARLFTPQELEQRRLYVQKNYDNDFFPSLHQVQTAVFKDSFAGPPIHENLNFFLIKPVPAERKALQRKEFTLPM
ncbi:MAG: CvpA family protein [Limisphaerales bacterium]|jgi:uncharacterized membrane protein required for colicin V production